VSPGRVVASDVEAKLPAPQPRYVPVKIAGSRIVTTPVVVTVIRLIATAVLGDHLPSPLRCRRPT
jgi:hypothetical protein